MTFSRRYRSFIIIILLIILSTNLLNQSIYSQESKEDGFDLPSNNNDLLVYMESAEEIVGTGDQVDFIITVTDSKSIPMNEVDIYGKMIYPDGSHEKKFAGKTDDNGKFVFSFNIDNNVSVGELKTQVKVTMPGFEPRSFSGAFIVVGASDSSPIGELDNNVQDKVQSPTGTRDAYSFAFAGDYDCDSDYQRNGECYEEK